MGKRTLATQKAILNLTDKYYYNRYSDGSMAITCLLVTGNIAENKVHIVSRGTSLKSPNDKINRNKGRNKACGRAIQAFVNKADYPIEHVSHDAGSENKFWGSFEPRVRDKEILVATEGKKFQYV